MTLTICMYFCILIRDLNAFPHFCLRKPYFCHADLHLFVLFSLSSDVNLQQNQVLTPTLNRVAAHISVGLEGTNTEKTPTLNRAPARPRATREPRRLAALYHPPSYHTLLVVESFCFRLCVEAEFLGGGASVASLHVLRTPRLYASSALRACG